VRVAKTRPVTAREMGLLLEACRRVEPAPGDAVDSSFGSDYLVQVMDTVLDLQMRYVVAAKSIQFFKEHRQASVRTLEDLSGVLARFPDDEEGNREAARFLWGNNLWTRVVWLRGWSLRMRLGVDTVKPDVHVRRFVEVVVGHRVSDAELIRVIEKAARRLGLPARLLDLALWEHQRGGGVTN